jgi:hypothetical protein
MLAVTARTSEVTVAIYGWVRAFKLLPVVVETTGRKRKLAPRDGLEPPTQ